MEMVSLSASESVLEMMLTLKKMHLCAQAKESVEECMELGAAGRVKESPIL